MRGMRLIRGWLGCTAQMGAGHNGRRCPAHKEIEEDGAEDAKDPVRERAARGQKGVAEGSGKAGEQGLRALLAAVSHGTRGVGA